MKIFGVAAMFAVAMFVNASVGTDKDSQDVSIVDLANATEANAECQPYDGIVSGRCLVLSQYCVFDTVDQDCNPYRM